MKLASLGLAGWLLQRFGVLERNESLMGDLAEERSAGRSVLWLWGQAFTAIADAVARDLRDHWLLALRAIAVGTALEMAWSWGMNRLSSLLSTGGYLGEASAPYLMSGYRFGIYRALLLFTFTLWPVVVGWIVARTHRNRQAAMVLAFTASVWISAAWNLTAHYSQMKSCVQCVPDMWDVNLVINCINVLGILAGGLVPRPSKRLA
jgi:hypothetical protein